MKKYPAPELIKKWEREELTIEQTVGQLLLWVVNLVDRVIKLEAAQHNSGRAKQ